MRVLLTTWGSRGDIEPLAGLASRLRARGAEVRVAASPEPEFAALLDRVGVSLVPLGPTVKSIVAGGGRPDAFRLAAELVDARFATLTEAGADCDALVATGLMPAGARDVAQRLGIRYVLACFHIFGIPSRHFPPGRRPGAPLTPGADNRELWRQDAERVDALYAEPLNRNRAAIGLPPITDVHAHVLGDRPWLAADPTLCPAEGMTDLELEQTGPWLLPDDRPLPAELESFLDAGEPPVYVGFGSMANHLPDDIARVAVDAVRAHGRRVVLAGGWAGLTVDGPGCQVVGEVNQQALFPRTAAVVHHGGAGTTTTAARSGVPQLIVPQIADQPYWAARVAELGVGAAHDGPRPTPESLAACLDLALTSTVRSRAATLAATISTDGADRAADLLLTG